MITVGTLKIHTTEHKAALFQPNEGGGAITVEQVEAARLHYDDKLDGIPLVMYKQDYNRMAAQVDKAIVELFSRRIFVLLPTIPQMVELSFTE